MAASAGLGTGRIFGRGGSVDSIQIAAWHGALALEQIWAGGRCIGGPHRTLRYLPSRWLELRREFVSRDLSLPGSVLGQGRSRRRARRGVPGGGLRHRSFLIIPFWAVGCSGQGLASQSRKEATVCESRGRACSPVVSWATEGSEGGSRDGGLSGQERTGQEIALLAAPTVTGPSCHSGYMSREGFYL